MSSDEIDPSEIVSVNPEVMGGTPVFRGTRVPIDTVFVNLAAGMSLDEIMDDYPTLDRDDVEALLRSVPATLAPRRAA